MNCPYCGAEILENASFCVSCGAQITREPAAQPQAQTQTAAPVQPQAQAQQPQTTVYINNTQPVAPAQYDRSKNSGLLLAAFILNLVTTIICGIVIIPLAWMIPMTVHSYGVYKGTKPNTTAFAVCTLLFLDLISGILMLVAGTED